MSAAYIKQVAVSALNGFDAAMLSLGLSGGKRQGHEYLPLNPLRGDHKPGSFSINTTNGKWSEFAADQSGGDLVSLAAYLWNVKQGEAAESLADMMGLTIVKPKRATGTRKQAGNTSAPPVTSKPQTAPAKAPPVDADVCVMPVPDDAPAPPASHSRHGKPSHRYAYTTEAGVVNFYHDRYEPKNADDRNQFSPLTLWRNKAGRLEWKFKAPPDLRPLFGLPRLSAFPDAGVWFVEGEKAAQAACELLPFNPVLSWQGGAQAVSKGDYSPVKGRACIVWPDNDQPGVKAAGDLVKQLQAAGAASVYLVNLSALALLPEWSEDGQSAVLNDGDPLAIGDDAADLVARGWQVEHFALLLSRPGWYAKELAQDVAAPEVISTPIQAPAVEAQAQPNKRGFELMDDGVYYLGVTKEGMFLPPRWICGRLEVLAQTRNSHNGEWGKLVTFSDPDFNKKRIVIPSTSFNGEGLDATGKLLSDGLRIAAKARPLVLEYLQESEPSARGRTTSRTGWHGKTRDELVFVLPDGAVGASGADSEEYIFDSGAPDASPFTQRGTLKQWRENVSALCAGNSRLVFAVCTAFASPLLHLINEESGGFHYRGGSSDGKTTALRAAASVCGSPEYMQRWRATDNGLEALAMTHCDAPLLLDELKQIEARVAGETAYMLANGSGKARANQNGGSRQQAKWRLIFLSAGELSLSQHMAEANKKVHAGQELRMADIPADAGAGLGCFEQLHGQANGHEFSKALAGVMGRYYGTAFPEFVRGALVAGEELETSLRAAQAAFEKVALSDTASGQARRAAARFALVGAAGEFATEWGITGWGAGESMKAAQSCFRAWLVAYGGEGNQEQRAILQQVRLFFQLHGEARFSDFSRAVTDDTHAPRVMNKVGWRKYDKLKDETEYYVYSEPFKTEICKGLDHLAVAHLLIEKGYMRRGDGKNLRPKVSLPGEGSQRVFHVLPAIFGEENA